MGTMNDETSQTSDAPDGADPIAAAEERASRMATQRREIGAKLDATLQEKKALEARIAELESAPAKKPAPSDGEQAPAWQQAFQAMSEKMDGLVSKFESHQTSAARAAVESQVLAQVPDGNHSTVKALLGGLGVDFTQPGAAADALAKLQEHHPIAMVDHTRGAQPRAPQIQPDGSIKPEFFETFKSFSEVPDIYKSAAMKDPKVFERLMGRGTGDGPRSDRINI
jgi:uncharacterized coiled-coil protein SlyX